MPKGVYPHTHIKPRVYPAEIVEEVRRMYLDECMTVAEVQQALPKGFKAQRIIERHIPQRRRSGHRVQTTESNPNWKADQIGYEGAHTRVRAAKGKASDHNCIDCTRVSVDWSYDGLCPDEKIDIHSGCAYSSNPDHYQPRCRSCHRRYDQALRRRGGDA